MPQDVKLSPDGSRFYVADMNFDGVWDDRRAHVPRRRASSPPAPARTASTPAATRGVLYVSNRAAGTVSVIDFATRKSSQTWTIPGGSPDMGGVSADGKVAVALRALPRGGLRHRHAHGRAAARSRSAGPHGLCVWPQPGRYSLGHTGDLR